MRPLSAIVLVGGRGRRMGTNKALLDVEGKPLVGWVLERLAELSDDVMIVARDAAPFEHLAARVVTDIYPDEGPLVGLHAGLREARHPSALAVACDMPFLDLRLVRYMIVVGKSHDAVVPLIRGLPEPLHAMYRVARCLPAVEKALDDGNLKMTSFLSSIQVRYMQEHEVNLFDPEHLSFFNVNTPDDLRRGREMARKMQVQQAERSSSAAA